MVSIATFCLGDQGSNPGWFAVSNSESKNWVYTNNTSLLSRETPIVITVTVKVVAALQVSINIYLR